MSILEHFQLIWVSYISIDFVQETIESTNKHNLLIMQGGLDVQVKVKHFDNYKNILKEKENVTFKFYEKLNHCFVNGENENITSAYLFPKDIPSEVINDIYTWINSNKK